MYSHDLCIVYVIVLYFDFHDLLCHGLTQGKYEQQYERTEEFKQELKLKVREILTDQEWRRRKMQMRVCRTLR